MLLTTDISTELLYSNLTCCDNITTSVTSGLFIKDGIFIRVPVKMISVEQRM